jgi:hypothetical protein
MPTLDDKLFEEVKMFRSVWQIFFKQNIVIWNPIRISKSCIK